ncbi:MAG: leucyl aminopeptidase [Acidimicrobiales bacterium]
MNLEVREGSEPPAGRIGPSDVAAVGVPVMSGPEGLRPAVGEDTLGALPDALRPDLLEQVSSRRDFTAKVGQTALLSDGAGSPPGPDIVLVGIGPEVDLAGDQGTEALRRAAAAFVRAVGHGSTAAFVLPPSRLTDSDRTAEAVAVGGMLGAYRFDRHKSHDGDRGLSTLVLQPTESDGTGEAARGASRGARIAESVAFARDLVNEPPSSLTPERLADAVVARFQGVPGVTVDVWHEDRITAERLGGLLGVARGSSRPPRLVRIEYRPSDPVEADGRVPHVALVGKGITFDSGGLSLKTASGMETMKTDMAGAAAVFGAVDAVAALGSRLRVTAIAPLTENMPGGSAIKPGDVLVTRNGKTIEVLNTDAEGRLVLADALCLASELGPDAIIDLATLTGAAVVALGKEIAGLFGNDDDLSRLVQAAGSRAGEPSWLLPLPDDYRSHIDSDVADMRNVGRAGQAGAIAAAMLLREFVGDSPWVHLDIAGPARAEDSSRYFTKGGTGFGVRTLVALMGSEEAVEALIHHHD